MTLTAPTPAGLVDKTTLLKFLNPGRHSPYQRHQWPEPGVWTPTVDRLEHCRSGWHVCTARQALTHSWLALEAWTVEIGGERLNADDKTVAARARLVRQLPWDHRAVVGFACDCAARALPIFEGKHPDDRRPRDAIETARAWTRGEATAEQCRTATNAADATNAAYDAAYAAAYAADAANAANAAAYAAYAADAANAANAYDAAYDAAYAAAYADATNAADAANDANAYANAYDAAYAAAYAAERDWQVAQLLAILNGTP